FGIDQIDDAQTGSGCFVAVGGADAAFGGADFVFAFEKFALGVKFPMIGKNEMGRFAVKKIAVDFDAVLVEALDFLDETDGVDDHAVADDANLFFAQDSRRDEVQDVFLAVDMNGVAGVIAALGAYDDVRVFGEDVNNFAFSFVAPLGA